MPGMVQAPEAPPRPRGFPRTEQAYAVLAGAFMVTLVLTNVVAAKLFAVPLPGFAQGWLGREDLTLTAGLVTYPVTFLLTDTVAEIWGQRRAAFMVWAGFGMSLLMVVILQIVVALPPSPGWKLVIDGVADFPTPGEAQSAYAATFFAPGILVVASMSAYLVAQLIDVRLYHWWWRITGGRHLWLRNNGSTWISQLFDTVIVNSIFLPFLEVPWPEIWLIIAASYVAKLMIAALDTPLIYASRAGLERLLGIPHDPSRAEAPLA